MNSDKRYKLLTQSRIPDFMGDIDAVMRNSLMSQSKNTGYTIEEYESIYNDIYNLGDTAGFQRGQPEWYSKGYSYGYVDGVTTGVTEFALSGADKLFVTTDKPGVYPFNDMNQLYHSDVSKPYIGRFLDQHAVDVLIPKQEQQFKHSLERVNEYTSKKISVNEYEINQLTDGIIRELSPTDTKEIDIKAHNKIETSQRRVKNLEEAIELHKKAQSSNYSGNYLENETEIIKESIISLATELKNHKATNGGNNKIETIKKINNDYLNKYYELDDNGKRVHNTNETEKDIDKRILLSDYLDDYMGLSSIRAQEVRLENTEAKITDSNGQYIPSQLRAGFSQHKTAKTAVFNGPGYKVLDLKQMRAQTIKVDKKAPLKTLQERSKEVSEFNAQEYLKNVADHSGDKITKDVYEHMNFKTPKKKTPTKSPAKERVGPEEKMYLTLKSYSGK